MTNRTKPQILESSQHSITLEQIPDNARKVTKKLLSQGYQAYLVGGCVRDLLLQHCPKDFDIATDAHPEQIKKMFSNCRLIGRRFRLAHIYFKEGLIEVATFRGQNPKQKTSQQGMLLRDNVFGTLEEDAYRRDFTINALYYDIQNQLIIDYTQGFDDLQQSKLTIIGDPYVRYQEDPVRMLRAARFAAKLNMFIETNTAQPIPQQAALLQEVPSSRLFDEVIKLFHNGHAQSVLTMLFELKLMPALFPDLSQLTPYPKQNNQVYQFIAQACQQTDQRIRNNKGVSCVFLYAVLLWPVFINHYNHALQTCETDAESLFIESARQTIRRQSWITGIPKRFHDTLISIWQLQYQLVKAKPSKIDDLLAQSRFRAGFDLLLLRGHINKQLQGWGQWWTQYQQLSTLKKQKRMIKNRPKAIKQFEF